MRRRNNIEVSMFPFLSVLCTVIGVLVLFIVLVLSTRVVQQDELYRRVQAHDNVPRPGSPDALEQGIDTSTYAAIEQDLARLTGLLNQRKLERRQLGQRLAALEDLLDYKKTQQLVEQKQTRGRPLDERERVVVIPAKAGLRNDGFEVKLRPILVECSATGYTMHPSKEKFAAVGGSTDKLDIAGDLKKFLEGVNKRRKREYFVFLIHPNGVETFQKLRLYVVKNHAEIRIGWEPFSRDWLLANDEIQLKLDKNKTKNKSKKP